MKNYSAENQELLKQLDLAGLLGLLRSSIKQLENTPPGSASFEGLIGIPDDNAALAAVLAALATAADLTAHTGDTSNPHSTSDANLVTTDVTTNNVSTGKHGFAPKLPNDATKYLDGTGAFSTPAGGGGASTIAPAWWLALTQSVSGTYAGYSTRTVISGADLKASGGKVRLCFQSHATANCVLDHVSIVERAGTSDDGTAAPTEVTFGGTSGLSMMAGGNRYFSDWITFATDETKDYLVIVDHNATTGGKPRYVASGTTYYKAATASYDQQTVSGFSTWSETHNVILIQVKAA